MRFLLAGVFPSDYYSFNEQIVQWARDHGVGVETFDYRAESRIFGKDAPRGTPIERRAWARMNERLQARASAGDFDFMLVTKGERILPPTVQAIRQAGVRTVLWFPDDPQLFTVMSKASAWAYDAVITSAFPCVPMYEEIGVPRVEYLPFCCDPRLHRPVDLTEDERARYGSDVTFIGSFNRERVRVLRALGGSGWDVRVWGPGWREHAPAPLQRFLQPGGVFGPTFVKAINGARVNLNVHDAHMKHGGMKSNIRTFEVTGSGGFLLVDRPIGFEDLFEPDREVGTFDGPKDVAERIAYYLEDEAARREVAKRGHERAYRDHTISKRMERVLALGTR